MGFCLGSFFKEKKGYHVTFIKTNESDHKSGMHDPYRNSNRASNSRIQRLPPMYDGDPVEDFEWHDKGFMH